MARRIILIGISSIPCVGSRLIGLSEFEYNKPLILVIGGK
jgi:hypothetical protein